MARRSILSPVRDQQHAPPDPVVQREIPAPAEIVRVTRAASTSSRYAKLHVGGYFDPGDPNPEVRRSLEVRKDIEKADYIALTSDRIAQQSFVITGNKGPNSEFDKFSKQAEYNRQQATELRQQWRTLTGPDPKRPTDGPTPQNVSARDATGPNRYADLKTQPAGLADNQAAELQKKQQELLQRQRRRGPKM